MAAEDVAALVELLLVEEALDASGLALAVDEVDDDADDEDGLEAQPANAAKASTAISATHNATMCFLPVMMKTIPYIDRRLLSASILQADSAAG